MRFFIRVPFRSTTCCAYWYYTQFFFFYEMLHLWYNIQSNSRNVENLTLPIWLPFSWCMQPFHSLGFFFHSGYINGQIWYFRMSSELNSKIFYKWILNDFDFVRKILPFKVSLLRIVRCHSWKWSNLILNECSNGEANPIILKGLLLSKNNKGMNGTRNMNHFWVLFRFLFIKAFPEPQAAEMKHLTIHLKKRKENISLRKKQTIITWSQMSPLPESDGVRHAKTKFWKWEQPRRKIK